MASLKRAKWIEGITQSKRVLRDIADIATSAIQDETGIVAAENWQLVYPRPFDETSVYRGDFTKSASTPGKFYPTFAGSEKVTLAGTTAVALVNQDALMSSVVVKSTDATVTYVVGTDYTLDTTAKTITRLAAGSIADGQVVALTYERNYYMILASIPIVVERKLTLSNPDRVIDPSQYTINYTGDSIKFVNTATMPYPGTDPVANDCLYVAMDFTEKTLPWGRTDRTKIQMNQDPLDPTNATYDLPLGTGAIAQASDTEIVGTTVNGLSGSDPRGSALTYTWDDVNFKVVFSIAPVLRASDSLYFDGEEYTDTSFTASTPQRVQLVLDSTDASGKTYKFSGVHNRWNSGKPTKVEYVTTNLTPAVYRHLDPNNAGYSTVDPSTYTVNIGGEGQTGTNAIPFVQWNDATQVPTEVMYVTFTARGADDRNAGLDKIVDRIVLKTRTTPEQVVAPTIGNNFGAQDTSTYLDMYVEMTKPANLINPETGLEHYIDINGAQQATDANNHYIQSRMFDRWDDDAQQPQAPIYDGDTMTDSGAYISDWSKYSWFKDWSEQLVDALDSTPGTSDMSKGIILYPVTTQGMTDEFPIQFWISANNNRLAMVLMGDPTLDQDNFLVSFAYFGRVAPFYDSTYQVRRDANGQMVMDASGTNPIIDEVRTYFQNDVAGNFAMTTGSSTLPAAIGIPPKGMAVVNSVSVNTTVDGTGKSVLVGGNLYDATAYSYLVSYLTDGGESAPTAVTAAQLIVPPKTIVPTATTSAPTKGLSLHLNFTLPDEATGYKVYRYHEAGTGSATVKFTPSEVIKQGDYKLVATVTSIDRSRTIDFVDDGSQLPMDTGDGATTPILNSWNKFYANFDQAVSSARSFQAVIRNKFTGTIMDVKFTDKWGAETATAVNDISMYQTRSGLKFQRHQASFITTEEFMRKDKSGQSRWTGKFHLSPVYIEHSYDKQRGWLDGVMVVDDSGIEHLDELIVDKDLPTEETYKFFKISAPFSFLNNSPNYAYGIAIIEESQLWN